MEGRGRRRSILCAVIFIFILGVGLWMRARDLSRVPPNGDESESAINALTILQTGFPRGEYLGLPIYENCLTEKWPENAEYEFRDSSYSKSGLAIYHGWLPLYAMAASFKAMGIAPDDPSPQLGVRHSVSDIRRRVIAARLPAVFFGGLFMILLFVGARDMFGEDAAWGAFFVGAIARPF